MAPFATALDRACHGNACPQVRAHQPAPPQRLAVLFSQQAYQASSRNILEDLNKILGFWTLTREELNAKTREI